MATINLSVLDVNKDIIENGFTCDNDPDTGESLFYCKQCEFKTKHSQGIKGHISKVHKLQGIKRVSSSQIADKTELENFELNDQNDEKKKKVETVNDEDGDIDVFIEDETIASTQVEKVNDDEISAEELVKMYESEDHVTDDAVKETETIPDNKEKNKTPNAEDNVSNDDNKSKDNDKQAESTCEEKENDISNLLTLNETTMEEFLPGQFDHISDLNEKISGLKAEVFVWKEKSEEKEEENREMKLKIAECELNILNANLEISTLTEDVHQKNNELKLKNEEMEILIAEKNSLESDKATEITKNKELEHKLQGYTRTIEKIFKEKSFLKKENEKMKNTCDLLQKQPRSTTEVNENIKKLNEKLKEKNKTIEELKSDKKRLANELATIENDINKDKPSEEKCLKLTNMLKTKAKEQKQANEDNISLKRIATELQQKASEANNKIANQEATINRLQIQVSDLMEVCGKEKNQAENTHEKAVSFDTNSPSKKGSSAQKRKKEVKCRNHDKGLCRFGDKCDFDHSSKITCEEFSKNGICSNEQNCEKRHPTGVCIHWKRGSCDRGENCIYRHPENEYKSLDNTNNKQRARTMSHTPSTNQNDTPFLFQQVLDLKEQINQLKNGVPKPLEAFNRQRDIGSGVPKPPQSYHPLPYPPTSYPGAFPSPQYPPHPPPQYPPQYPYRM